MAVAQRCHVARYQKMWHNSDAMALKQEKRINKVRVGGQGRIVIPAHLREALGLKEGDTLIARVQDRRLVLETSEQILRRLQEYVRSHVPPGVSLVDELLAERRAEARKEMEELESDRQHQ